MALREVVWKRFHGFTSWIGGWQWVDDLEDLKVCLGCQAGD